MYQKVLSRYQYVFNVLELRHAAKLTLTDLPLSVLIKILQHTVFTMFALNVATKTTKEEHYMLDWR